jgi:ABC-2 type transport system permease protein
MTALRILVAHTRFHVLDLLRWPGYIVPTIVFPAMFFVLFDLPYARRSPGAANFLMLAFMIFAIVGVTLYQFGVNIALDRGRPWERYLRTLPASVGIRFGARIITALLFGIVTALLVAIVARALTPVNLTLLQWSLVLFYGLCGGVPFVLIGVSIGYWTSARAAVPIATAVNLLFAYAGGLWFPPADLPGFVQRISPYLPTRQFAELMWSVLGKGNVPLALTGLALYAALFVGIAAAGYRRDERKRYA